MASEPEGKPAVDLIVVRENTECLVRIIPRTPVDYLRIFVQYVKQETLTQTESGKEARATRLITERASRRIGTMAFELALARPRKVRYFLLLHFSRAFLPYICASQQVTIIHKSNVLSVTDGLFRETVRAVPNLPEVAGRFDGVTIAEQIVDSAVYRFDSLLLTFHKNPHGILAGSSVNQSKLMTPPVTADSHAR